MRSLRVLHGGDVPKVICPCGLEWVAQDFGFPTLVFDLDRPLALLCACGVVLLEANTGDGSAPECRVAPMLDGVL